MSSFCYCCCNAAKSEMLRMTMVTCWSPSMECVIHLHETHGVLARKEERKKSKTYLWSTHTEHSISGRLSLWRYEGAQRQQQREMQVYARYHSTPKNLSAFIPADSLFYSHVPSLFLSSQFIGKPQVFSILLAEVCRREKLRYLFPLLVPWIPGRGHALSSSDLLSSRSITDAAVILFSL